MAVTSAWAVGSLAEVTAFQPSARTAPSRTITAPKGPPWPASMRERDRATASARNRASSVSCIGPLRRGIVARIGRRRNRATEGGLSEGREAPGSRIASRGIGPGVGGRRRRRLPLPSAPSPNRDRPPARRPRRASEGAGVTPPAAVASGGPLMWRAARRAASPDDGSRPTSRSGSAATTAVAILPGPVRARKRAGRRRRRRPPMRAALRSLSARRSATTSSVISTSGFSRRTAASTTVAFSHPARDRTTRRERRRRDGSAEITLSFSGWSSIRPSASMKRHRMSPTAPARASEPTSSLLSRS